MTKYQLNQDERNYLVAHPKAVICFETGELFVNPNRANEFMELPKHSVRNYVRGARKYPINGYTFAYLETLKGRRF